MLAVFSLDRLSKATGLVKNLKFICPLDKQLSNFPHPQPLPILLNIFCVYVATWPLAHCVDKRGLDLTFSEVKFTCMKWMKLSSSCAPVFSKPSSPRNIQK